MLKAIQHSLLEMGAVAILLNVADLGTQKKLEPAKFENPDFASQPVATGMKPDDLDAQTSTKRHRHVCYVDDWDRKDSVVFRTALKYLVR